MTKLESSQIHYIFAADVEHKKSVDPCNSMLDVIVRLSCGIGCVTNKNKQDPWLQLASEVHVYLFENVLARNGIAARQTTSMVIDMFHAFSRRNPIGAVGVTASL
jgi:hypothetical protein